MTGMKRVVVFAIGLAVASTGMALAGQQGAYRLSDQQLNDLANRIDTHKDTFQASLERAIDRSPIKSTSEEDQIERSVKSFEQAADLLRDRVKDRRSDTADAENVLRRAALIDNVMLRHQLDTRAQGDWQALRAGHERPGACVRHHVELERRRPGPT